MKQLPALLTVILLLTDLSIGYSAQNGAESPMRLNQHQMADSSAYKIYKSQRQIKSGEIQYLIHLIKQSNYTIVRGNRHFSSHQAARYLNFKYTTNLREISSAEDFIDQFASHSKNGDPIYVINGSGEKFLASQMLYFELRCLRNYVSQTSHRAKL